MTARAKCTDPYCYGSAASSIRFYAVLGRFVSRPEISLDANGSFEIAWSGDDV